MGLGAYPASGKNWLGMLGMHGTYEANMAMHDCDVMICIGARFDDRITGRSTRSRRTRRRSTSTSIRRRSTRTSASICRSSAMRQCAGGHGRLWRGRAEEAKKSQTAWWSRSPAGARAIRSPTRRTTTSSCRNTRSERLFALTKASRHLHHDRSRPAPDVGGAVLRLRGAEPLDDLGRSRHDGLRPAGGARRADRASRTALVIDIAGDASIQMTCRRCRRRCSTMLPIKIFILNNQYMGMVRQWQQLLHGAGCRIPIRKRCPISSSWPKPMAASASAASQARRSRRRDPGDDRGQEAGAVRLPRRISRSRTASR
jgi:acetolactate synthase-1/2/3 large subunit